MKHWMGILMMLALVVTTTMPQASHASHSAHHESKTPVTTADATSHSHATATTQTAHAKKHCCCHGKKKSCCKGVCKCAAGNCHSGGVAKLGSPTSEALLPHAVRTGPFAYRDDPAGSAPPGPLKRPPKA